MKILGPSPQTPLPGCGVLRAPRRDSPASGDSNYGAGSVITALDIACDEEERRGFIRFNLLALAITAAAVRVAILALVAIAAMGHVESLFPSRGARGMPKPPTMSLANMSEIRESHWLIC